MRKYFDALKKNTLFDNLDDDQIARVLSCAHAYVAHFDKHQTVRESDVEVNEIGIVVDGLIYKSKEDYNGKRIILSEASIGQSFGESLAFTRAKNSPIILTAAQQSTVIFLKVDKILPRTQEEKPIRQEESSCWQGKNPQTLEEKSLKARVLKNTIALLAQKIMLLQMKNDILSQKTTREKLLLYFEYESKSSESKAFEINFSREEMADFLALNANALSRELGKLRDEGLIVFRKNRFVLK